MTALEGCLTALEGGLTALEWGAGKVDPCDLLYPGTVVGHPHVYAGQVRVRALDAVAHSAHQDPSGTTRIFATFSNCWGEVY